MTPRRALLYNPGLHLMGGGERYTFALAEVLLDEGLEVCVAGPTLPERAALTARGFSTAVPLTRIMPDDVSSSTRDQDLFIHVTVCPPFQSFARRSFAVVQFPMVPMRKPILDNFRVREDLPILRQHPRSWFREQRQSARGYRYLVYSKFARLRLWTRWHKSAAVLPPPVDLGSYDPTRKKPIIIAVGRVFPEIQHKRYDVLIEAFRVLSESTGGEWQLVLVGGVDWAANGATEFVASLEARAKNLAVTLRLNAPEAELRSLYDQASLFWHAAGCGRSRMQPEQAEHFGISVVEAMSHGAVPLVYADGGPREIVRAQWGERWRTIDELVRKSRSLIDSPDLTAAKAGRAANASQGFSTQAFGVHARALLLGRDS